MRESVSKSCKVELRDHGICDSNLAMVKLGNAKVTITGADLENFIPRAWLKLCSGHELTDLDACSCCLLTVTQI